MFKKEVLEGYEGMEDRWKETCEKSYGDKRVQRTSFSGIPVKEVYSPSDVEGTEYKDIGMPGEFPYTRGTYPMDYQIYPWAMQFGFGYGLPEHTRERYIVMRDAGMTGPVGRDTAYFVVLDHPSQHGFDPDDPLSRGRVGYCGCSVSTMRDYEILFDGIPIEKINVIFPCWEASWPGLAMHFVYCERRGIPQEKLMGLTLALYYHQVYADNAAFTPKNVLKLAVEQVKYCSKYVPKWNNFSFNGYNVEEAGANAIQEIAFNFSAMITLVEECMKVGLNPDDFLHRFGFYFGLGNDMFENVAKIRAARRMWAKITKDRFGCKNPRSQKLVVTCQNAGSQFTAQQPYNNIVRATLQTLSGILAGSRTMWTTPYDESFSLPTEEAATIAVRTNQIILHESRVPNVSDPLAGSYYVEWLTNEMEKRIWDLLDKIEAMGWVKGVETGWFRGEIEKEAYSWRKKIDSGEEIQVGVNKYEGEEHGISVFEVPDVEDTAIERIEEFRKKRDNGKVEKALDNLRDVSVKVEKGEGDLMPALIEAARADATNGEMGSVLREVFGYGYTY